MAAGTRASSRWAMLTAWASSPAKTAARCTSASTSRASATGGCGIRINMQPYNYLLAHGEDPVTAYQKTYADIMRNIEFRTWYRNKALGSDYEDEVVLHAVRDDLDDPYAVLMKNAQHEAKIRDWQGMTAQENAGEVSVGGRAQQRRRRRDGAGEVSGREREGVWAVDFSRKGSDKSSRSLRASHMTVTRAGPSTAVHNPQI
eukprot:1161909-Pelagomonas_calceolata.AAC.13